MHEFLDRILTPVNGVVGATLGWGIWITLEHFNTREAVKVVNAKLDLLLEHFGVKQKETKP